MQYSVLFVDDEAAVRQALERLFRDGAYSLSFAADGGEALAMLEKGMRPAVIVTGQQMPGMSGVEFLRQAKKLSPKSMRLMLTGHAELNAAMDAINSSGIFRYILKPWNDADLKKAVADAVTYFSLAEENRRLTREITEKNLELEEINSRLEQKVAERTKALKDAYEENLILTRELQGRIIELEGRDRILRHLLTIHELEDTLHITLEVICQVAALDWAAVYLPEENNHFRQAAFHGRVSGADCVLTIDEEIILTVFNSRQYQLTDEKNISLLLLPVRRGEQCLAVVAASRGWNYRQNAMTRDDVNKIEQFMLHIAIAVTDAQVEIDLPAWDDSLDDILQNYLK